MRPQASTARPPGAHEIVFLPLGGTGKIGMNLSLYGHDGHWIIVDIGITFGNDPDLPLDPGDTAIFSSRLIPGNEPAVQRLEQRLGALGIRVVTDDDAAIHVSGHPAQDDLRQLYDWVSPACVVPVHGTPRHLAANADIATECGVAEVRVIENGELCRFRRQGHVVHRVGSGRLAVGRDGALETVPPDVLQRMRSEVN